MANRNKSISEQFDAEHMYILVDLYILDPHCVGSDRWITLKAHSNQKCKPAMWTRQTP